MNTNETQKATYQNNPEIQDSPQVCEVFSKANPKPLQQHLKYKQDSKNYIGNFKWSIHVRFFTSIKILESLKEKKQKQKLKIKVKANKSNFKRSHLLILYCIVY